MKPNKIIDDFDKNIIFHAPFRFNYHCNLGSKIMRAKYHNETQWPDRSQDTFLKLSLIVTLNPNSLETSYQISMINMMSSD